MIDRLPDPMVGEIAVGITNSRQEYVSFEIGAYDPERWSDQGWVQFGMGANVFAHKRWGDNEYEVRVGIGGIQAHDVETGRLRAQAYSLAISIGEDIERQLKTGVSPVAAMENTLTDFNLPLIRQHDKEDHDTK